MVGHFYAGCLRRVFQYLSWSSWISSPLLPRLMLYAYREMSVIATRCRCSILSKNPAAGIYMYLRCSFPNKGFPSRDIVIDQVDQPGLVCVNHSICIVHDMSSISDLYERSPSTESEPETKSTTDFPSTSESSYKPSETSFVVSDAETLSPRSFSDYSTENDISDSADDLIESVSVALSLMIHPAPLRADIS